MSNFQTKLSRRTVLRGLGVSLALPWLEATGTIAKAAVVSPAPTRMAFIFVPNGVVLDSENRRLWIRSAFDARAIGAHERRSVGAYRIDA